MWRFLRQSTWANAALAIVSTAVTLMGLEVVLRTRPALLGRDFANGALSKYTVRDGGIYYFDRNLRMEFMIPNFKTRMYYNGYVWTHETDAFGFRNRKVTVPADIVLLGDSMIYGHGLEYESTVGYLLERLTGLSVANLARQGDCAFQEAYLLTEYVSLFRPRYVLYFFNQNDIADVRQRLTTEEMQAFINTPVDRIQYPTRVEPAQALRERDEQIHDQTFIERIERSSYVFKAYRWIKWRLGVSEAFAQCRGAPDHEPEPDNDEQSLAWRYTKKAIAYMQYVAARHNAQFVIVPITPWNQHHYEILRAVATEYGLPFLDTSSLTTGDASPWLPHDGHLSPAGARKLAEIVAVFLSQRPERGQAAPPPPAG